MNQQAHVNAVNTSVALVKLQQTAETSATNASADATQQSGSLSGRLTATALAIGAANDALATQAPIQATATVEAAQFVANARATQVISQAATSVAVQATQTSQSVQSAANAAATAQGWLDRCVAALQITALYEATLIATSTSSVDQARTTAAESGHYNPYGAVHDANQALADCQGARGVAISPTPRR